MCKMKTLKNIVQHVILFVFILDLFLQLMNNAIGALVIDVKYQNLNTKTKYKIFIRWLLVT